MKQKIYFLGDHKCGFHLLQYLYKNIINLKLKKYNCILRRFFIFWDNYYTTNDKYIIIIRNPREVVISGYLYHKNQCKNFTKFEKWSRNSEYSFYYYYINSIPKKIRSNPKYQKFLKMGESFSKETPYVDVLNNLSQEDGIIFEINNVSKLAIWGMNNLTNYYGKNNVLVIKYNELVFDLEKICSKIVNFLDISEYYNIVLINLEKQNLLILKKKNQIPNHTTNKTVKTNRYLHYWNEKIENEFKKIR